MPHEEVSTAVLEAKQPTQTGEQSSEVLEQRLSFLTRMRQTVGNELKLTFTLPNPKEGILDTLKDASLKGLGMAGVYAGKLIFTAGEQGQILHSPNETEQTLHHVREATEGVGISTAVLGAATIIIANRIKSTRQKDDARFLES